MEIHRQRRLHAVTADVTFPKRRVGTPRNLSYLGALDSVDGDSPLRRVRSDGMGRLKHAGSERESVLLPEHLIGRSGASQLKLEFGFVSSQHAVLRWTGHRWEVRDLGSRNGTSLNASRLSPGQSASVRRGDILQFGDASQEWTLEDDSAPGTMVIPLDGGDPLVTFTGMLAIPSPESPDVLVYYGADGEWQIERPDEPVASLAGGQTFQAAGRTWRFFPETATKTSAPEEARTIAALHLHLAVSRDEEYVELKAECRGWIHHLGSRAHNYLLLVLARERMKDRDAGLQDSACGWMYQDDLLRALAVPANQLNIDVFRVRKLFASLEFIDAANIIERRPRLKQLRIGAAQTTIVGI